MISRILHGIPSLMDIGDLPASRTVLLAAVLLFFLAVFCANKFFGRKMSVSKVVVTLKFALAGFLLLLLEPQVAAVQGFGPFVSSVQALVVMLCLANLVTYLLVDVYFFYRMDREVPSFIRDLFTALVYVLFAMAALRLIFRLDISSILTTTTVLTAAVAFAMQTTIANIISGFYVQNDKNLRLKTWLSLKEQDIVGEVVNVGFRYTTLKGLDNTRVMVPNNYIMQNVVTSLGYGDENDRTRLVVKVGLAYDLPPERAKEILLRILKEDKDVANMPPPSVRLRNFADSCIEYDMVFALKSYHTCYVTKGNILSRVWYAVTREGSSIPFPHREVISKVAREPFVFERQALLSVLKGTEILQSLSEEELLRLSVRVHPRVFAPGEIVVRQGELGESLYIVMRGGVKVSIDENEIGSLGPGNIFGEMSLLTGEARKATVTAAAEVHLVEILKEDIAPLFRTDPELLDRLSAILAKRAEENVGHRKRIEAASVDPGIKESFREKLKAFFNL